jgi:hypothetical protein
MRTWYSISSQTSYISIPTEKVDKFTIANKANIKNEFAVYMVINDVEYLQRLTEFADAIGLQWCIDNEWFKMLNVYSFDY